MNPENTNGKNQNVAEPNLNQNMMNQNMTFPVQNLQSAQNSFTQNSPLQASPSKPKRPVLIACIVGVIILIVAIIGIACVIAMRGDGGLTGDTVSNVADDLDGDITEEVGSDAMGNVTLGIANEVDVEKFKQMTKDEAIAFLQSGRSAVGNIPKDYAGEEIMDLVIVENNVIKSDVSLRYSHETMDDLRHMAEEWYGVLGNNDDITEEDYEIKEYDYYAVVIPNRIEGTNTCDYEYYGSCNSLLSFKYDYINHFQEQTTPNSYNDATYLNVRDPETVKHLMRIFSLFYNYGIASGHGNIYDSSFAEQEDRFILTIYYVGVGFDVEKFKADSSGISYAINLYSRQYAVDKADGRLYVIQAGEDSTMENIKSISITQKEAASLLSR